VELSWKHPLLHSISFPDFGFNEYTFQHALRKVLYSATKEDGPKSQNLTSLMEATLLATQAGGDRALP
jgi:hypothetical protein